MIEAPAPACYAEEQVDQTANGQQQIGHDEVLTIQYGAAGSLGLESTPHIISQHTGQAEEQNPYTANHAGGAASQVEQLHDAGNDVFKYSHHCGEAGEGHEQEEQGSPHLTAGHVGKYVGQGDENQARACIRGHAVGEACREDNQPGADGHKGVQGTDVHGFAAQGVLAGHVAAEDFHGTNAQTQGKEGLIHGGHNHLTDALLGGTAPVRQQEEGQTLLCAGQGEAVHGQHCNEQDQGTHHYLGNALHAILKTQAANQYAKHNSDGHENPHFHRVGQHLIEHISGSIGSR